MKIFRSKLPLLILAIWGILLGRGTGLSAATIEVSQNDDSALRNAISQAAPGDTIHLSGFVALTNGELVINKNLAITGDNPNTAGLLVVSNVSRLIRIETGNVCLSGISLRQGNASGSLPPFGGAIYSRGNLSLSNVVVLGNMSTMDFGTNNNGGGIYSTGNLDVTDCTFAQNMCSSLGGAIYNKGTAIIRGSSFLGNQADMGGGAIENSGTIWLTNCTVEGNLAISSGGGGLSNLSNSWATVQSCTFRTNTSEYYGGGAIINFGTLVVRASTLQGNIADKDTRSPVISGGGAIHNSGGVVHIEGSVIGPDNGGRRGGGILNVGNTASAPARLTMFNSTIYNNSVELFGGGLMNYAAGGAATASLTNVTVSGNKATNSYTAGGVDNSASMGAAQVYLMSCTVASNSVNPPDITTASGGIFCAEFGTGTKADVTAGNSIVAYNPGTFQQVKILRTDTTVYGSLTSLGHNLCSDFISYFTNSTDLVGKSAPGLAPLFQYGLVRLHPLLGNNPGIDQANAAMCPPRDARGFPRFGAGPDIGAFENTLTIARLVPFPSATVGPNVQILFTAYRTNYTVEYTDTLRPNEWTVLTNVTRVLPTNTVVHGNGWVGPQRFYRIKG